MRPIHSTEVERDPEQAHLEAQLREAIPEPEPAMKARILARAQEARADLTGARVRRPAYRWPARLVFAGVLILSLLLLRASDDRRAALLAPGYAAEHAVPIKVARATGTEGSGPRAFGSIRLHGDKPELLVP